MSVYVAQLPKEVQKEIKSDVMEMFKDASPLFAKDVIENVMNSKLIDVIGWEKEMLSYKKYSKWL